MTDIEALKNCRAMWNWLAEHPTQDKYMYFCENDLPIPVNLCHMCAYVKSQNKPVDLSDTCGMCLIRSHVWPTGCTNGESAYTKWMNAQRRGITEDVVSAARAIADACTTELKARGES